MDNIIDVMCMYDEFTGLALVIKWDGFDIP